MRVGVEVNVVVEVFQWRGEVRLENELRNGQPGVVEDDVVAAGFPEDGVEDDVVVERVFVVAVLAPVVGAEVDLDVAFAFGFVGELDGGVAEIGAGFDVPPAGEDDACLLYTSPSPRDS